MASRNIQDAFMDDSDESCPLCVEEFDLSDKNFRPCPCGYQVCQFCYNNIKNNMNGLCPACRRPYDEQSIEWKIVSPEEQKADIELQARKKAAARKKESERKQVETNNRKHLAGLRVVQKNLVYVVGLSQKSNEEDFLQTLRGDQYFGQYGKIIKIVVSKAKEGSHNNNTVGVYVTFERREDAAKCIAAVDGSKNLDRPLRAQYGTTKYCSAYLRNEQCQNRNCTFLHETGEDYDSFSRQDLSSMNAMSTQRPAQPTIPSSSAKPQPMQPQPPPQQAPQNISAASQLIPQQLSRDEPISRSDSAEGPALPSHANWAARNAAVENQRSSKPPSVSAPSPIVIQANLVSQPAEPQQSQPESQPQPQVPNVEPPLPRRTPRRKSPHPLDRAMKVLTTSSFNLTFDRSAWSEDDLKLIDAYPPLFAPNGGHVELRREKERERQRLQQEEERNVLGAMSAAEEDENPASGSFQLGGEPETHGEPSESSGRMSAQQRQPSYAPSSSSFPIGGAPFQQGAAANLPRTLTPQQQQQLALLRSSASSRQSQINHSQFQQGYGQNTSSLHGHQQSNPFQMQIQGQTFGSGQGHTRQASRFTFANDSASASTAVKPAANPQLMAQQSTMMPPNNGKQYQQSNTQNNHFYSGVQGPPPGLKSSGTPPISGGGMFGQGHGFASAMGGSAGFNGNATSKNTNEELMRDLLRSRNGSLNGQGPEIGKRELNKFPFAQQHHMTTDAPASSLLSSLYGSQLGAHLGYQDHSLQKQKKKGKKHRHANTSSSGGGGIVDLADPSILQARMHHSGAGQGQYSAQGQDQPKGPRFAGPTSNDDNYGRVSANNTVFVPLVPRASSQLPSAPTPVPPGLSSAQDFPPLAAPSQPPVPVAPKLQRKVTTQAATPTIKPIIPVVPAAAASKTATATAQPSGDSIFLNKNAEPSEIGLLEASKDLDTSQSASKAGREKLEDRSDVPAPVHVTQKPDALKIAEKRGRPENLNLEAINETSKQNIENAVTEDASANATAGANFPSLAPSQPATPATISSQASAPNSTRKSQPKTIRLSGSTKNEMPSPGTAPSQGSGQASRRPSVTSINRPETPASERISDNVSYTSASISRANSPPPSRVGTAPMRRVTKSQQKKERQERAKKAEEEAVKKEEPATKAEETVVQAPIIGRKKKTKKTKEKTGITADSTPAVTRPASPEPQEHAAKEEMPPTPPIEPAKGPKESKKQIKLPPIAPVEPELSPSIPATPAAADPGQSIPAQSTAADIFADLQGSGELSQNAIETLFKPITGASHRFDHNLDSELILSSHHNALNPDQAIQLDNNEPVVIVLDKNNALLVFPNRRCLKGLNPLQAARYKELHLRGCRAVVSSTTNDGLDSVDRLMPSYQSWGEHPTLVAPASNQSESTPTPQLTNRFADHTTLKTLPQAPLSVNLDVSAPRSLLSRVGGPEFHQYKGENRGMGVEEAEAVLAVERKNTEALEKRLNALIRKNRRLVLGSGN